MPVAKCCHFICLKPGHCPEIFKMYCVEECSSDSDCTVNQRCCFNGCGYICTPCVPEKPGSCPYKPFTPWCDNFCGHDSDCTEEVLSCIMCPCVQTAVTHIVFASLALL
uniref:WAP domain-containing protein n=1 Tax=Poecilia mexicana TaxID=48701 RepID=A0A3B3WNM3_9TELE